MKIAILGRGFGLYGYMPALIEKFNCTIQLPLKYQDFVQSRSDISHFDDQINWVHEDDLLDNCQGVIIAVTPDLQPLWAEKCLGKPRITHLLLEKPLASTPVKSEKLLKELQESGKIFRIGFNFRFTEWGKDILVNGRGISSIEWNFYSNHYAQNINTWKMNHVEGGGSLRFYGIHLIAFLAELGYNKVLCSKIKSSTPEGAEQWFAHLEGANLLPCKISVRSKEKDAFFKIRTNEENFIKLSQPFESRNVYDSLDQRVPILKEVLGDLYRGNRNYLSWYSDASLLWKHIEEVTDFELI